MTLSPKTLLITGATGKQGGAVISALLEDEKSSAFKIIAVTRNRQSQSAQALASKPNVSVIEGDISDPDALFDQAGAVWGVFAVQVNSDAELEQGKALVTAAAARGVSFFVYASGDRGGPERSAVDPTFVKNFSAKYHIEKHLEKLAQSSPHHMSYVILRPVTFFENITRDIHGKGFARMWQQMGTKKLQLVSTKDIGWFAANAFRHPDEYRNQALTLAGDELEYEAADAVFKEVTGSPMEMTPCVIGSAVKFFKKDTVGDMFRWFEEFGYGADVGECRKVHPKMLDYRAWLTERSTFV